MNLAQVAKPIHIQALGPGVRGLRKRRCAVSTAASSAHYTPQVVFSRLVKFSTALLACFGRGAAQRYGTSHPPPLSLVLCLQHHSLADNTRTPPLAAPCRDPPPHLAPAAPPRREQAARRLLCLIAPPSPATRQRSTSTAALHAAALASLAASQATSPASYPDRRPSNTTISRLASRAALAAAPAAR